jgi:hypothetical protein
MLSIRSGTEPSPLSPNESGSKPRRSVKRHASSLRAGRDRNPSRQPAVT